MPKFNTLTISQLKEILREYDLNTLGTKQELVARLVEHTNSDEINAEALHAILPSTNKQIQQQVDSLKLLVESLAKTVQDLVTSGATQRPSSTPNTETVLEAPNTNDLLDLRDVQTENSAQTAAITVTDQISNNSTGNATNNLFGVSAATHSMRDVMSVLPDYDPGKGNLTSQQFIDKVESLKITYGWHDNVVLFAVQGKLKGHAKSWLDSQDVFREWKQFVEAFLGDFPCDVNIANIHIDLMKSRQYKNEAINDYYYRMLALGRQGKLDDRSIIQHTINGLNDEGSRNTLNALQFMKCTDFHKALLAMTTPKQTPTNTYGPTMHKQKQSNGINPQQQTQQKVGSSAFTCYNCHEPGHISSQCSKPQRRNRCKDCQKVHPKNEPENCGKSTSVRKVNVLRETGPFEKYVKIANLQFIAYIDTGSECHMIRQSCANTIPYEIEPCYMRLSGLWGGCCVAKEKINVTFKIDELIFTFSFFIVEDNTLPTDILLGGELFTLDYVDVNINQGNVTLTQKPTKILQIKSLPNADQKQPIKAEQIETGVNDDDSRARLLELLNEYRDVFADGLSDLGKTSLLEMQIKLTSDQPIAQRPYRIPEPKKIVVREMISQLLLSDIIVPSSSNYASPMLLVKKKDGTDRLCVDFRKLNKYTAKEVFPMPNIEESLQQAKRFKYFISLDMNSGFYQIPIAKDSRKFTAFVTFDGIYEFKRMPFGLKNAPAVFQRLMAMLSDKFPEGTIFYMDDILIGGTTIEQTLCKLRDILIVLRDNNLTLNLKKCSFISDVIDFLGHRLTPEGIEPGLIKTFAIRNFPQPSNIKEVRRFLGLSGYFRKFVPGYALIAKPLCKLLQKDQPFVWSNEQTQSFEELKQILASHPVLTGFNITSKHEVHTDASCAGLAGVLLQEDDGHLKPVAYFSRATTNCEKNYHSYELEALAVVETLERFRYYVYGAPVKVVTDCNAITTLMSKNEIVPRIARWWLKLQDFDVHLEHRTGQRMLHVDALSRAPVEESRDVEVAGMQVGKVTITSDDWLFSMQLQDPELKAIITKIEQKDKHIMKEYVREAGRLFKIESGQKLWVVPKALRRQMVQTCHDESGHLGVEKTIEKLRSYVWFARMRNYVKSHINACIECAYNKYKGGRAEGQYHFDPITPVPFKTLHLDHVGPFPKTARRNEHILVMVDAFTKYTIIKPVPSTATKFVIRALNDVLNIFGAPERIVTDRGTSFTSKDFANFCRNYDIYHQLNAVRTPRANGHAERANRTLLNMLTTTVQNDKGWDACVNKIQWSLNTMKNATTGKTPHQLLFSYSPRDILGNKVLLALSNNLYVDEQDMTNQREAVALKVDRERALAKERFDRQRGEPTIYSEGDIVLVENEPVSTGTSRKLEPRYKGPFLITRSLGKDRYVIEDLPNSARTQRHYNAVHASDKIKHWCKMPTEDDIEDTEEVDPSSSEDTPDDRMAEL